MNTLLTTLCPACGFKLDYEPGVTTIGCSQTACRVVEFIPHPLEATHA